MPSGPSPWAGASHPKKSGGFRFKQSSWWMIVREVDLETCRRCGNASGSESQQKHWMGGRLTWSLPCRKPGPPGMEHKISNSKMSRWLSHNLVVSFIRPSWLIAINNSRSSSDVLSTLHLFFWPRLRSFPKARWDPETNARGVNQWFDGWSWITRFMQGSFFLFVSFFDDSCCS